MGVPWDGTFDKSNSGIYYFRYTPLSKGCKTKGVKQHHFPYMNQIKKQFQRS